MPKFTVTQRGNRDRRWLNSLFYGPPGSGKTHLLGTACEAESMQDVLYVDVEAGDETLEPWLDSPHLTIVKVTTQSGISDVYKFLGQHTRILHHPNLDPDIKDQELGKLAEQYELPPTARYRACCLDSLTEINALIMYQILGITLDEKTSLDAEPDLAEFKEWNQGSEMTRLTVRAFRNLPIHVLMACGATDKGKVDNMPDLPGKLSRAVQGFVDVVGFLQVGAPSADAEEVHRLFLTSSTKRDAKSRLVNLKDLYLDNPTMSTIIEKARGGSNGRKGNKGKGRS